jgi:hypothetical protein
LQGFHATFTFGEGLQVVVEYFDLLLHELQIGGELSDVGLHTFSFLGGGSNFEVDLVLFAVREEFAHGDFGDEVDAQDDVCADFVSTASYFAKARRLYAEGFGEVQVFVEFEEVFNGVDEFMFVDGLTGHDFSYQRAYPWVVVVGLGSWCFALVMSFHPGCMKRSASWRSQNLRKSFPASS